MAVEGVLVILDEWLEIVQENRFLLVCGYLIIEFVGEGIVILDIQVAGRGDEKGCRGGQKDK